MSKLTEEMVIARSRQSDLGSIKKFNCWGGELTDVSIVRRMRNVEVLALSVNKISTLADFEDCHKLQDLYLRKNNIKDINDLAYLQGLKHLKSLWLEENPCVDSAGPNYRSIVLRALPNLEKLDNITVTPEEVAAAANSHALAPDDDVYEEAYNGNVGGNLNHSPSQQSINQQPQYRTQSPIREPTRSSPENTEESISDPIDRNSIPTSPLQRTPPNQDYSPAEPNHPSSPKYRDHRNSYHQSYDRSPGSEHTSPVTGYKDRPPIAPSISTQSMKEYYQSDRPTPTHYRHSQTDLSEWEESPNNHNNREYQAHPPPSRRNLPPERDNGVTYPYRNGSKEKEDWEDTPRREARRSDGRFSDSASVVSNAVINHYASIHRRPINRSSNLLSAILCLVKELDYPSLEVVEHAVRCRIDELTAE